MYITQSVIQKEFEKPGFECAPLGYDDHYEISIGYAECKLKILEPNPDTGKCLFVELKVGANTASEVVPLPVPVPLPGPRDRPDRDRDRDRDRYRDRYRDRCRDRDRYRDRCRDRDRYRCRDRRGTGTGTGTGRSVGASKLAWCMARTRIPFSLGRAEA